MPIVRIEVEGRQIILHQLGGLGCTTPEDLVGSTTFAEVVGLYVKALRERNSPLLEALPLDVDGPARSRPVSWMVKGVGVNPFGPGGDDRSQLGRRIG